ncbi:MAG: TusE/DsrC/DsvC family sulfur relay protein [Succinivibrio sp.]|nr:TusE/DsrC/DsvC family sulfur relay protein [Succinivibrio sp.]
MTLNFNGREILTDPEGFLVNRSDWSQDLMYYLAEQDGLTLDERHLLIINKVREYYETYATTPAIRVLIQFLKVSGHPELASSLVLARLFPNGAAKSAAKYAGLPKPVKCV